LASSLGRSLRRGLVVLAAGLFMLGLLGVPASAKQETAPVVEKTRVEASADGARAACAITRYGYAGQAMCGTFVIDVDWNGQGWLETFIIAPNRTIWHVWPGSGGWFVMPGGGLADDMYDVYRYTNGDRLVEVWVNGVGRFCTKDPAGSAGWNGWRRPPC
jgi:hypothetical protein